MSGVHGYPPFGPPPQYAVSRLVAAALLVVAAALAVGGSFGAFSVYRFASDLTDPTTITTTGWGTTRDPAEAGPDGSASVLHGIPLSVAAVLALVAALLLLLSARRPGDPAPGRLLGVGAVGLLVGVVAVIWLQLVTFSRNVAASLEEGLAGSSRFETSLDIGLGGYLILTAALAALAAGVLLMVPRRGGGPLPYPAGPVPPYGPVQAPWPGGPPAPGWDPPPHHR